MYDFPTFIRFVQHDRPSVDEPHSIVEMERHDGHIFEGLYSQFAWLNVHVRSCRFVAAYLLEHRLERLLEFRTTVGAFWYRARIKHGGIVIEGESELLPIQVIECPNKSRQRLPDICLSRLGLSEHWSHDQ